MYNSKKGALLIILAGACWGMISIFIFFLTDSGLSELQISFVRQLFASVVFALFLFLFDRERLRIRLKDLWLLMLLGFINGVVFNFCYFYTIVNSRASIAVVLLYTSPVFVMILARLFFKEKITQNKLVALFLTVIGCVFVTGVLGEGYTPPPAAILTGVLTGLAYALNNIITSMAVRKNDPRTVTFYTFLFSFVFLIPFSGCRNLVLAFRENPKIMPVIVLMCLVTCVFAQFFFSVGLRFIESGRAAIYGATEPIVGSLVGILVFHEESNFMKIAGIAMVIVAIVIIGKDNADSGA